MLRRWIHVVLALVIATTMSWSAAHARATFGAEGFGIAVSAPCEAEDCDCDKATQTAPCKALAICAFSCSFSPVAVLTAVPVLRKSVAERPIASVDLRKGSGARPPDIRPPIV